jgi:hypothetical protein
MEVLIGLVFQVVIEPVLHLLDQGVLCIYSALNCLDINIIWLFHGLQGFGNLCQILFLTHAEGWLWRPLLRQKDIGLFHWRNQESLNLSLFVGDQSGPSM